jgi:hypothetical protein
MFEIVVLTLMAAAALVLVTTWFRHREEFTMWPAFGLLAFILVESRVFVDTPSLSASMQSEPDDRTLSYLEDRVPDLVIGAGLSLLGLACAAVFFAGIARRARRGAPDSLAGPLVLIGAGTALGTSLFGWGLAGILADAASLERAPTTLAATYTLADSTAYIALLGVGLVTAGVALASLQEAAFPRPFGWFCVVLTAAFALMTFLPAVAWFPALLFLLVGGVVLLLDESRAGENT